MHLVDLDAAFGRGSNADLLAEVVGTLDIDVELSGGIRDDASLAAGAGDRLPAGQHRHRRAGEPAVVRADHRRATATGSRSGLDVRGSTLAARGWTEDGGDIWEVLERLESEGCARYVVTDVTKDGTLQGPNVELLRQVCAAASAPVVASGGVSSLDDLRALAALNADGVEGAIVGKALYAGAFTLPEALAAVS